MGLTTGQRLGAYAVVAPLGAGGMGEVWRATDTRLGRDVALKLLPAAFASDPDRLGRFEREAKLLAALSHTHIAGLYALEEATLEGGSSPVRFLAMELAEGEDLAERLRRGAIPVDEAIAIARQVAEARSRARERIASTASGTAGLIDFAFGISPETTRSRISAVLSPVKRRSPVNISKSTLPSEKMSLRWSARISITNSGAM